jgi:hypothetical protein
MAIGAGFNLKLPKDVAEKSASLARQLHKPQAELLLDGIRRYLREQEFIRIQTAFQPVRKKLGLRTQAQANGLIREARKDRRK